MKKEELITIVSSVIIGNLMVAMGVYYAITYHLEQKLEDINTIQYEEQITKKALDERFETTVWNSLVQIQGLVEKKAEILKKLDENNITITNDIGLNEDELGDLQ